MAATKRIALFSLFLAISVVSCAKRSSSERDKLTANGAIGVAGVANQTMQTQAQAQAANQGVKVSWDAVQAPGSDNLGNISIASSFLVNGRKFQISTTHQATGSNVSVFQQQYSLGIDNMAVAIYAGCSDSQCSQYVVTYNFYKNNSESIQQLVWVDFAGDNSPRVQQLPAGSFADLYTWYKFASDANNFLAP